jgi:hypothetical protein
VQALSLESSAIAADATVLGPTGSKAARLIGWSCVHDGVLACDGVNDWGNPNLVARDHTMGTVPLFGKDYAEQWHCVVLHVRLDRPGSQDGHIALTIDGELDAQIDDLELVGSWAGARLNAVKFSSWWPNVPHPLERHIDDVVVATVPLGCPSALERGDDGALFGPEGRADRDSYVELMFKAKGEKHRVTRQKKAAQIDPEIARGIEEFVDNVVTVARLEQALEQSTGNVADMRRIGDFLRWIGQDVRKETVAELEAAGLEWKDVAQSVTRVAKQWFRERAEAEPAPAPT